MTTVLVTFVIFLGCVALLSLSLLLTGKKRITGGTCGKDPTKKKDSCDKDDDSCGMCGR